MRGNRSSRLVAEKVTSERKLNPQDSYESVRTRISFIRAPKLLPQRPSDYDISAIIQGATIVPQVLVWVSEKSTSGRKGWTKVKTGESRQGNWSEVKSQRGLVPTTWIRKIYTSSDMLPFVASIKSPEVIIPISENGEVHLNPTRACSFWQELDELWEVHRTKGKTTPDTLLGRLDYAKGLSIQPLRKRSNKQDMVLYPTAGDNMRAARTRYGSKIVDSSLYWHRVSSDIEAGYLVSLFNARCLRRAFAESKESGRNFHKNPWRNVPIPLFNKEDAKHNRLGELCSEVESIAKESVTEQLSFRPTLGQPGLSKAIRDDVANSKAGKEIERIVRSLLPRQTDRL